MKPTTRTWLTLCAASIVFWGCGSDDPAGPADSTEQAPDVPPTSSMTMDFGFFTNSGAVAAAETASMSAAATKWNWITAVVHVTAMNLVTAVALEPPAHALALAFDAEPKKVGDRTYRWEYVWREGSERVEIDLEGAWNGNGTDWALYLSGNFDGKQLEDELWFHGQTSDLGRDGYWLFRALDGTTEDIVRLDWNVEGERDAELSLEIIGEGRENTGSRLAYSVDDTIIRVEWRDDNQVSYVTWDETSGAGSILTPEFNEGRRACWDEEQEDVDCADGGIGA